MVRQWKLTRASQLAGAFGLIPNADVQDLLGADGMLTDLCLRRAGRILCC